MIYAKEKLRDKGTDQFSLNNIGNYRMSNSDLNACDQTWFGF